MNEITPEQVAERIRKLYDTALDQPAADYIGDLENNFEPAAYEKMSDSDLMDDVERYRDYIGDYYLDPAPHYTDAGRRIQEMKNATQ